MTNVTTIHADMVPQVKTPDEDVIKAAEKLLALAISGDVVGFCLVCQRHDGLTTWSTPGQSGSRSALGALVEMQACIAEARLV